MGKDTEDVMVDDEIEETAVEEIATEVEAVAVDEESEPIIEEDEAEPELIVEEEETAVEEVSIEDAVEPEPVDEDKSVNAHLYSAGTGAVLGVLLTLLMLFLINGTLNFAADDRADSLALRLDQNGMARTEAEAGIEAKIGEVNTLITVLTEETANLAAAQEGIAGELLGVRFEIESIQTSMGATESDIAQLSADTAALETASEQFEERLTFVAESAENFDLFLDNLRDMLIVIQGLPPTLTPTITPTATITPTMTITPESTATVERDGTPAATVEAEATPEATAQP